ncbi:MAG: alanine racemase, partial [Deinococcota bacterium]
MSTPSTLLAARVKLLQSIARDIGTPTYVYDLDIIRDKLKTLTQTFAGASLRYAVKANPSAAVLTELARHGVGAEAITIGELERALAAGIPAKNIVLGGPAQDARLRARALEANVGLVSLDSLSQAETWLAEARLPDCVIRVNPALDPHTHEHLATGAASSKFGMTVAEAQQLAPKLGKSLRGFHVHAGSQIDVPTVYDDIFNALSPLYEAFPQLDVLDIGGGFAVPNAPLADMAVRIQDFVKAYGLTLIVEPGRYVVAEAGTLLTEVLHVKEGARKHVICSAGMADLLRPALYGAAHPIQLLAEDASTRPQVTADIDGPLCENADR